MANIETTTTLASNDAVWAVDMRGVFIETAFTAEQIERSIEIEKRLGLDKLPCAFLSSLDPTD